MNGSSDLGISCASSVDNDENEQVATKINNTLTVKQKSPRKPLGQVDIATMPPVETDANDGECCAFEYVTPRSPRESFSGSENFPKQFPATIYEKLSSVEIEPGVRCSTLLPNGALVSTPLNEPLVRTGWDVFQRGLRISRHNNCLGWREGDAYKWWTYEEVAERVRQLCAAFKKSEPELTRQQFVGIYAACVPQWLICSLAVNARSMCVVPLYDSLGPESCSYIINQTEIKLIFVDSAAAANRILSCAKETPSLKKIICFQQDLGNEFLEKARSSSISVVTLAEFVQGADPQDMDVFDPPKSEDIAMIQYTSGTTGMPKGVIQTHRSNVANLSGIDYPFSAKVDPAMTMSTSDIGLLYLPLAHTYAQTFSAWFFFYGGSLGFFGGNIAKLAEDATILKPTFMPMVPRLMNRIYGKIKGEIGETGLKATFFSYCYSRKKDLMQRGVITRNSIWDMLVFRRVQNILGGNVRLMSVGSAPISADVLEFFRVAFGALIIEAYGQTECTAAATFAIGPTGGCVGHPLPCNYVKLVDAEECGYFVKDGKGEVCVKGANVMSGYYKQPEKTAEAIDVDGWLHTGDIGEFIEDGSLRIFDRKKHIFKLAQGEYIAPEKIENFYAMCPLVAQVFVDGSSLESFTVAVVVSDSASAQAWAKANNADPETVMENADFAKHVLYEITKIGKANKLNSLEQVKNVHISAEGFTPDNGLLTPSMKNKRPELRRFFKDQIEAMYKAGPLMGDSTLNNNGSNGAVGK